MPTVDVRASVDEVMTVRSALKTIAIVLLAEINMIRSKLVPPLAPLTLADIVSKMKVQL